MKREKVALVMLLTCTCGRQAVAINETRITGHKCDGRWKSGVIEKVPVSIIKEALRS